MREKPKKKKKGKELKGTREIVQGLNMEIEEIKKAEIHRILEMKTLGLQQRTTET